MCVCVCVCMYLRTTSLRHVYIVIRMMFQSCIVDFFNMRDGTQPSGCGSGSGRVSGSSRAREEEG